MVGVRPGEARGYEPGCELLKLHTGLPPYAETSSKAQRPTAATREKSFILLFSSVYCFQGCVRQKPSGWAPSRSYILLIMEVVPKRSHSAGDKGVVTKSQHCATRETDSHAAVYLTQA